MSKTMDKLAKELKAQMNASDARKPKPYDAQAEVLRVEDGVAWVHIPGGVEETPVRLTINAKKGDMVNIRVANGSAWITGNGTNPPTDDTTANYAVNISNEAKKDVTILNTVVTENIEATNAKFGNVEADTAKIHNLTADQLTASVGYIEDLTADNITANDISAASGYIKDLTADNITANDISAASGYIKDLVAEDITAGDISADHATIDNLDANYAQINAANVTDLSAQNAWVNKIMVQTGLLAHEGTVFTLDAIQVNAANITAGTIDVNRLIVTVDGEKYLVEIDPTTHQPSYEKLDGGIVEPRTITADKIVAHDITVQEITTENLVGTNGWINLNQGKFFFTTNGTTWANTAQGIMWDGTNLKIKGDVNITSGNVYTKTEADNKYATQTALNITNDAIKAEVKAREQTTNMLLDSDTSSLTKVNALYDRYWSDTGQASWCTTSVVELSDPPEQGIKHAYRFVATASDHSTDNRGRAVAFYNSQDTSIALPLKVGTKYTISFWARCTSGQGRAWAWYAYRKNAAGTDNQGRAAVNITDVTSTWKYFTGTVELESETLYNRIWFYAYFPANTAGTVEICGCRLIAGDNVEAYSTKIEQTANNVLIQATRTDTTAAQGGQHLIQSLINVAPSGVTIDANKVNINGTTVFSDGTSIQSRIDAVEIGGRNLARGTAYMIKGDGLWSSGTWRDSGSSSTYNYTVNDSPVATVNKGVLVTTASANARYGIAQDHCPILSKKVTYSVWAKGTAGGKITLQSVWWNGISNVPNWSKEFTANGSWQYLSFTTDIINAAVPDGNCSICYMYWTGVNANDTCIFVAPKLEYGTKATDWTPAPEDVQAEVDAKKSVHTIQALNTSGTQYTVSYADALSYATEGRTGLGCRVASVDGIKPGDTVRMGFALTDTNFNGAIVYIVGTVDSTSVGSYPSLYWTSHGLDTTIIKGGNILTNSIGANQIAADSIGAKHLTISDNTNLAMVNEEYESSLLTNVDPTWQAAISGGYLVKKTATQPYIMLTDYVPNHFKKDDELYYEFYAKAATAGTIQLGAWGYTGTPPTHTYNIFQGTDNINITTTEQFYSGTLKLAHGNWTTAVTQYVLGFNDSKTTKSQLYVRKVIVRRKNAGELIVDGSITTDKLSANAVTIGKINQSDSSTASAILNSNVKVGGKNIAMASGARIFSSSYLCARIPLTERLEAGVTYTFQMWGVTVSNTNTGTNWIRAYWGGGNNGLGESKMPDSNGYYCTTFTVDSTATSRDPDGWHWYLHIYNSNSATARNFSVKKWKLERGNKPTDWSPCPADTHGGENLLRGTRDMMNGDGSYYKGTFRASGGTVGHVNFSSSNPPPIPELKGYLTITNSGSSATSVGLAQDSISNTAVIGKQYTESCWVTCSSSANGCLFYLQPWYHSSASYLSGPNCVKLTSDTWQYVEFSGTLTGTQQTTYSGGYAYASNVPAGGVILVAGLKLEEGTTGNGWAPAKEEADASTYITQIDGTGIKVSPSDKSGNDYLQITANNIDIVRNGVSMVGIDDSSIRVGKSSGSGRVVTTSTGINVFNGSDAIRFSLGGDWLCVGDSGATRITMSTSGDSPYVYMNANGKTAFNADKTGISLYDPSTGVRRSTITANGLNVYDTDGTTSVAAFGATARVGKSNSKRIELDSSSFAVVESNGIAQFSVDATSDSLSRSYTRYLDLTGGGFIAYARFVAPGIGSSIKVGAATAILNVKNAITTTLTLPTTMNATTTVTANNVTFAVTKEGKYVYELNASASSGTNYYAGFKYTTTFREALVSVNDSLVNTQEHLYVPVYTSVGTLDDCTITTWGRIAQIRLEVHKSSVSSGSNVFEGVLSDFIPIDDALICGYYGGRSCPGKIESDGSITVRNAGSSSVSPTASSPLIVLGTYIFDPSRTAW